MPPNYKRATQWQSNADIGYAHDVSRRDIDIRERNGVDSCTVLARSGHASRWVRPVGWELCHCLILDMFDSPTATHDASHSRHYTLTLFAVSIVLRSSK